MHISTEWNKNQAIELLDLPFIDLLYKAQNVHRENFDANKIQISSLLSIKTGGCPEDCKYCSQSSRYKSKIQAEKLLDKAKIMQEANRVKESGASRFCMGAAWRDVKDRDMCYLTDIVQEVKALGLETCMTLGKINDNQAKQLKGAGLDYYNHNIDTSKEYYDQVITTRKFEDRLETIQTAYDNGLKTCSGGIVGMGESQDDRISMLLSLANMDPYPDSVPINMLVKNSGTPFENIEDVDWLEFVKTIALARIMMPKAYIRLSAGRNNMSQEMQVMCFMAGANSIFYGEKLLTAENPEENQDDLLFKKLKITKA